MSSPGFGLSGAPQPSLTNMVEKKLRAERVVKSGASWFLTVGALSIINSVLSMSGAKIRFIFGLGIAELVDGYAHQVGQTGFALEPDHQWIGRRHLRNLLEFCAQRPAVGVPDRHGVVCG